MATHADLDRVIHPFMKTHNLEAKHQHSQELRSEEAGYKEVGHSLTERTETITAKTVGAETLAVNTIIPFLGNRELEVLSGRLDATRTQSDSPPLSQAERLSSQHLLTQSELYLDGPPIPAALEQSGGESDHLCEDFGLGNTMNSGVGVLNTTLRVRPSLPQEGIEDGRQRFRKVSLVKDDEQDRIEHAGPGPTSSNPDLARTEKLCEVRLVEESFVCDKGTTEPTFSSFSFSYPLSSSRSQATSGTPQPLSPHKLQEAAASAVSWETPLSLGKMSEVQWSSQYQPSGRDLAEPTVSPDESEQMINSGRYSKPPTEGSLTLVQTDNSFSGVFTATRVELPSPTNPDPSSPHDMEILVDTLKSLDRPPRFRVPRPPPTSIINLLPPIEEDSPDSVPREKALPVSPEPWLNGSLGLLPDLGLGRSSTKDMVSPLEMIKKRSSMSDSSKEVTLLPQLNGVSIHTPSRLDSSLLFSNYRSERPAERSLFRTASLPESSPTQEWISIAPTAGADAHDTLHSRYQRFSSLLLSSDSLTGGTELSRMPPQNAPPSSLDLSRLPSPDFPSRTLQRSLSTDSAVGMTLVNDVHRGSQFTQLPEPDRSLVPKYRAFPDAYLTKEKEHGKLNPRPGKLLIYTQPGMCGDRIEVRSDIIDATAWELGGTVYIRVVRGGWVLYEKPNFKGEKYALDEGDIELTFPFGVPEEGQDGEQEAGLEEKQKPKGKLVIGSLRRVVRDYSVPEIALFPEENAEGKKIIFRDTSEDARIFGLPVKANSIIINAGLWLVYAEPFFQGIPRVLEVGGYSNPASWGVTQPYVGSVHPLKIGEPSVEKPNEPKLVIYEKPYFTGKSREICTNMRDFMTRMDWQQTIFVQSPGSIKVLGGCWVGYNKEGFRGHQYLLEEGEYHDWRVWGGCDSELRSMRLIRADFSQPMLVMFEMLEELEEEEGVGAREERTFEVTEAIPDVELFGFPTATRSIHVLSGAWVIYSHVDFSGDQYILEKGFYQSCSDWGAGDNRICSVQPIRQAPSERQEFRHEVLLYSERNFLGSCQLCDQDMEAFPDDFCVKSCRVLGGSWVAYESRQFSGNLYALLEGDYPNLSSMGCLPDCSLRSLKTIPMMFTVPTVSLFGSECFEGREVTVDSQVLNVLEEGYNNLIMSVRVKRGCWVLCEYSNFRGRQILLEPIEISNWLKFSEMPSIGSLYPIRQRRHYFRIRNQGRGHFLSIQGGVEKMNSGRVVVSEQVEGMSDLWYYQDGLLKNKIAPSLSLQVMGQMDAGSRVVLWSETRMPVQTWCAQMSGTICSLTFEGMVLDIKGGTTYDRDHVVILGESAERPCQQWELQLL